MCVARWRIKLKVYINLQIIINNIKRVRARTRAGVKLLFMVKADAYGHGLCEVALATESFVDGFGVATLEEGLALRSCGIKKPILLLVCCVDELKDAIDGGLTICLSNEAQLSELERLISSGLSADDVKLHIALDSGMHRLGFEQLDGVLKRLSAAGIDLEGAYSHLRVRSRAQIAAFERMCKKVRETYPDITRHLAASRSLECKSLQYDMVRVGISAYLGAMSVESEVVASRRVAAGEYVSYGNFKVKRDTNVAVVFGGYADGVARERPSAVYIHGRECKPLGRVCMDMTVVDCGDFLPNIGEKAVLLDGENINDVAKQRGSIEYTLMTCWRGRTERIYYDESGGEADGETSRRRDER
ncbi:MAG: alanine racemase [Bacteroides sp.]|nr:alanine racemase [Bacillota bacterium]MCM1394222.1 alanine racemase [[Eubacterium] siraeum]MCM1455626.1 alanine racemase [Bacteroides sp.]